MEWLLILVVAHNFFSIWITSRVLDRILGILTDMINEMERMRKTK